MDSLNMFTLLNEMDFINPVLQSTFVPVIPIVNSNWIPPS
jgi:hypothetical protein